MSYLNYALGVLQKRAIDKSDLKDDLVILVWDKGITLAVISTGHLVAIGINLSTASFIELNARECLLYGGQNLSIRCRCFIWQITFELLNIQIKLCLAIDHVSGADDRMSWFIRAHGLSIHGVPGARLRCKQVEDNFAINRFAVGVADRLNIRLGFIIDSLQL